VASGLAGQRTCSYSAPLVGVHYKTLERMARAETFDEQETASGQAGFHQGEADADASASPLPARPVAAGGRAGWLNYRAIPGNHGPAGNLPASGGSPVASFATAAQSTASHELGAFRPSVRPVDTYSPNLASISQRTLLRPNTQSKTRVQESRTYDPCGAQLERAVPITTGSERENGPSEPLHAGRRKPAFQRLGATMQQFEPECCSNRPRYLAV